MRIRTSSALVAMLLGASLCAACDEDGSMYPTSTGTGGAAPTTSSGGGEGGAGVGGEGGTGEGGSGGIGVGGEGGVGGSGGSGGGDTGADLCPGDPYPITLGESLALGGSTAGETDDYTSYCGTGTGSGPDRVYALTAMASGTMMVSLVSESSFNGVLYAQETCGDQSFFCSDEGDGVESFAFDAEQGMTYYLVVDGRDETAGHYQLNAHLAAAACGDGVTNAPTEDCDFGDTNPGDGCDATCQFEAPTDNSDTCPGQLFQVMLGVPLVISSFTTGYTDDYTSCGAQQGAPDRVFALFATATGTMTVTLPNLGAAGSGFDGVLAAWAGTCDPSDLGMPPYLGCSDGALATDTETLTFAVTSGSVYFVVVDGYANYSYGNFELTAAIN